MKTWRVVIAAIAMAAVAACQRPKLPPEKYEPVTNYQRGVVWLQAGRAEVKADVSWPEGPGPFPVVVWFHGGSWRAGSRSVNEGLARYLTNRGYVVMNMDYRLAPAVKMKALIEDAQGAVIWAKDHASEYHGDPARLAVAGHSAGGHLAAMAVMACGDPFFTPSYQSARDHDCHPAALVPVSGAFAFAKLSDLAAIGQRVDDIFGVTLAQDPVLYQRCSPVTYLRPDLPPQLVVYAEQDFFRPAIERYLGLLDQAGAPHQSYLQPRAGHPWVNRSDTAPARQTYDRIIKFLNEELQPR